MNPVPQWWLALPDRSTDGPFTREQLLAAASQGSISTHSLVCRVGTETWVRADSDPGLGIFHPPTTPQAVPDAPLPQHDPALRALIPVGIGPFALISPYVGFAALLIWPLGLIAILLGILALREAKAYGGAGTVRAVVAMVLGALGTLVMVGIGIQLLTG
jgi:hypothetical protein